MIKVLKNNITPKTEEINFKDCSFHSYCALFKNKKTDVVYSLLLDYRTYLSPLILGNKEVKIDRFNLKESLLDDYEIFYTQNGRELQSEINKYITEYYSSLKISIPLENTFCYTINKIPEIITLIVKKDSKYHYTYLFSNEDLDSHLMYLTKDYSSINKAFNLIDSGFIYQLRQKLKSDSQKEATLYMIGNVYSYSRYYNGVTNCLFNNKTSSNFTVDSLDSIDRKGKCFLIEDKEWVELKNNNDILNLTTFYKKEVLKDINNKCIKVGDKVVVANRYNLEKDVVLKINNQTIKTKKFMKVNPESIMILN